MNIDSIGPETVDDYYRRGLVRNIADLYTIQKDAINASGTREKSATEGTGRHRGGFQEGTFERAVFATRHPLRRRNIGLLARHFKTNGGCAMRQWNSSRRWTASEKS